MPLKLSLFVWALYVDKEFIEYFDTYQSAIRFAKNCYPNFSFIIKPVSVFTYVEKENDSH
ncbi:MAG: hypothetical protein DRJ60_06870 [Thermoprotei archaeon]|nr:MAG: hypothetical protein DRJ60_06870 [Thermoprotei archaeon]